MKKIAYLMIFTLSLSLLSGCGWRLRGSDDTASNIQQAIYLAPSSGQVYDRLNKTLTRKKLSTEITAADIQLVLGKENFVRRSASVNNQARTTQYQLTLSVPYKILNQASEPLTKETTAELSRYYTFNQNAITSSDKEEQALRKEMVRQVSRQILQRVIFLSKKKTSQ